MNQRLARSLLAVGIFTGSSLMATEARADACEVCFTWCMVQCCEGLPPGSCGGDNHCVNRCLACYDGCC